MTVVELDALYREISKKNGCWLKCTECAGIDLCTTSSILKDVPKIETKGKSFYLSPVYQVFDTKTGRRVYASTNQNAARSEYRWYCNHVAF